MSPARPAPLREIIATYCEPADGRLYDVLDCGHTEAQGDHSGAKRRRCTRCRFRAATVYVRLHEAGVIV